MKECMYSYHYNQRRAIIRREQSGRRVLFWVLGIVVIYGAYCLSTFVRA
ncbi:hypothetical protein JZU71_04535 [bacterium]|nr:hypothetical protein [bacterium]